MSVSRNTQQPIVSSRICLCCNKINLRKCRLLDVEYECSGKKEIYTDLLLDCYGVSFPNIDEIDRLICNVCVMKLRKAQKFKNQILNRKEELLKTRTNPDTIELDLKLLSPKGTRDIKNEPSNKPGTGDLTKCSEESTTSTDSIAAGEYVKSESSNEGEIQPSTSTQNMESINEKDVNTKVELLEERVELNKSATGIVKIDLVIAIKEENQPSTSTQNVESITDNNVKVGPLDQSVELNKSDIKTENQISQSERIKKKRNLKTVVKKKKLNSLDIYLQNAITMIENSYIYPFTMKMNRNYCCAYCKEEYTDADLLMNHTLMHNPKNFREFVDINKNILVDIQRPECRLCDTKLDSFNDLKCHLTNVHKKVFHEETNKKMIQAILKPEDISCDECIELFDSFESLKKHLMVHLGVWICDVCNLIFLKEKLFIHHKEQSHKSVNEIVITFSCMECNINFNTRKDRDTHMARDHKNPGHKFKECNRTFRSNNLLKRHTHSHRKVHPCESCKMMFKNVKSLINHMKDNHVLVMTQECEYCDKIFYLPSQLRDHARSHTQGETKIMDNKEGESVLQTIENEQDINTLNAIHNTITIIENSYIYPFAMHLNERYYCDYCKEKFTDEDNLRDHILSHDPATFKDVVDLKKDILVDIRRIECRLCDTKLDSLDDLKCHLTRVHEKVFHEETGIKMVKFVLKPGEISCIECDKSFETFEILREHMVVHVGTWVCDICGLYYYEKERLMFHYKEHKMYSCSECKLNFNTRNERKFHLAEVHNIPGYYCDKCDMKFPSFRLRNKHKLDYHGEIRGFQCKICNNVYTSRRLLGKHTKNTHMLTQDSSQVAESDSVNIDNEVTKPSTSKQNDLKSIADKNVDTELDSNDESVELNESDKKTERNMIMLQLVKK